MSKVSIVKCIKYEKKLLDSKIKEAVDLIGGIKSYVKNGQKVLVKPNMLADSNPDKNITTNPVFLEAVINLIKSAGGIPFIGDSPAFVSQEKAYQYTGFLDVAKRTKAKILKFKGKKFDNPQGKFVKKFILPENLHDFDLIVNVPKLKTHSLTGFTGATKNIFGLVVGKEKSKFHFKFSDKFTFIQMILDLYLMIKPQLNIMDGIVGMEGDGPASGDSKKVNLIFASNDALSLDFVALKVIDFENSPLHKIAKIRKINPEIEIKGLSPEKIKIKDYKKPITPMMSGWTEKILTKLFIADPHVNPKLCTGCEACYKICPSEPKTISMQKITKVNPRNKKKQIPVFNYDSCIHCYCCHEVCPEKAIYLKRKFF